MGTGSSSEADLPARVLAVAGDRRLTDALSEAIAGLSQRHMLILVAQTMDLLQYLEDTMRSSRFPTIIVVDARHPTAVALVAWMSAQRNAIADVPVIGVGADTPPFRLDKAQASIEPPSVGLLIRALRAALVRPGSTRVD